MSTSLTTPPRLPSTSRLAAYWLAAVVLLEAVAFSLVWHVGDSFIAWILGSIALMALIPLLIAGTALMVEGIVAGWRSRSKPLRRLGIGLASTLVVAIGIGLTAPIHQSIGVAMTWSSLLLNHARYGSIIDQVRRGEIASPKDGKGRQESTQGITYEAERFGPRRVAFILPDHWLSDRQVILYDPSIRPRGAGRDADIDREQASLFDGWLKPYECSRLSGLYLSCYLSPADVGTTEGGARQSNVR